MQEENKAKLKQEGWGLLKDILNAVANRGYNMLELVIKDSKTVWDDALLPALEKVRDFALNAISKIGQKKEVTT
ncbi:hypothetical protein DBY21_02950 [Candidatus Gastranaerophilales bacterium]|nr:MAG: hypothetical protein DBY21_02950 [Candidatus Gastranaerophilales bacterium]